MPTTSKPQVSPRAKKLDTISRKIALFAVGETYTDEQEAQAKLAAAIKSLDEAKALLKDE